MQIIHDTKLPFDIIYGTNYRQTNVHVSLYMVSNEDSDKVLYQSCWNNVTVYLRSKIIPSLIFHAPYPVIISQFGSLKLSIYCSYDADSV